MLNAIRDILLSLCPAAFRRAHRPESPVRVLRAATWGGLAQFFLGATALVIRFKTYFFVRTHQLAPHVGGGSEVVEAGIAVFITIEYLLYPLSLLLLYLAIEGLVRFVGGLITAEALPNFVVFLVLKAMELVDNRQERRRQAAIPPDTLEELPDGRIRIASAQAKLGWNASIIIGVNGQWFEVEQMEQGTEPREFVYLLRPSPAGKILRGYQEYDVGSALPAITPSAKPGTAGPVRK